METAKECVGFLFSQRQVKFSKQVKRGKSSPYNDKSSLKGRAHVTRIT